MPKLSISFAKNVRSFIKLNSVQPKPVTIIESSERFRRRLTDHINLFQWTKTPKTVCSTNYLQPVSSATFRYFGSGPEGFQINCSSCTNITDLSLKFSFVCSNCKSLLDIPAQKLPNYFKLLGVEESYLVSLSGVTNSARKLQKTLHPDLFSLKSQKEKDLSASYSSYVNKASATLLHPVERGLHLLKIKGHNMDSDGDWSKRRNEDVEFLGKVMELNEALENIDSKESWLQFKQNNSKEISSLETKIEEVFNTGELEQAISLLAELKYFISLKARIKDVQEKLGITE